MIKNSSFETALGRGGADQWFSVTLGTGEDRAVYQGDSDSGEESFETFDHGWSVADPQTLVPQLIVAESTATETMDRWLPLINYIGLGALSSALFDDDEASVETWALPLLTQLTAATGPTELFTPVGFNPTMPPTQRFVVDTSRGQFAGTSAERFVLKAPQLVRTNPNDLNWRTTSLEQFRGNIGDYVAFAATSDSQLPDTYAEGVLYYVYTVQSIFFGVSNSPDDTQPIPFTKGAIGTIKLYFDPGSYWTEELT